ncbi:restriction endonuclease subunit S [Photorhabdus luminescens]|uniref:restriction endonuclease subunit S n=1 Tax=Photorhabdus luminescens TaxID=29488 RepID=UPI00223FBAEE|nr:restriction endonuclease subunit S [Photorhabdus luminescens]MCW7762231.1 restriction endonuclease subunit S [Photorhabdus luminescens subsp. venezuelensis]
MSNLSFMEKMLEGVEVEWSVLGNEDFVEVANTGRKPVKASLRLSGKTPYYGANNIQDYVKGHTHEGEFVLIAEDGSASLENYSIQYVTGKFWANNHIHVVRGKSELSTRFLFHYLRIVNFIPYLTGGGRAKLTKGKMLEISIPIPPLNIQTEIVRILDTFTELTAELTAELTVRKKQYNYYRDQLLSFEEGEVEWKTLRDISTKVSSGGTPLSTREDFYDGDIPWLRTQEVCFNEILDTDIKITELAVKNSSAKWIPANCVIVAISGATAARSAINKIPLTTNQHCCNLEINPECANYRYVFHWVCNEYDKLKALGQGARSDLNAGIIKNYPIPIPYPEDPVKSLAEQERIVGILDKFDTLTSSISEGLPREIELRQKQYKYYRDLLLNFPKPEVEA